MPHEHFVGAFSEGCLSGKHGRPVAGERAKFLARYFGIFSEEIPRIWCRDDEAPFEDLGRPTLSVGAERSTIDFTLLRKSDGAVFVAEMKCEIAYDDFRVVTLTGRSDWLHHRKPAFDLFKRACARDPEVTVKVDGKQYASSGGILIWGAATPAGVSAAQAELGVETVLTVAQMAEDLRRWGNVEYIELLENRRRWVAELSQRLLTAAP